MVHPDFFWICSGGKVSKVALEQIGHNLRLVSLSSTEATVSLAIQWATLTFPHMGIWIKYSSQFQILCLKVPTNPTMIKVHIFWEGQKILRNLHQLFVLCTASQIIGGEFAKFCRLLRIYELYQNFSPLANGTDLNRQKYTILQTHWH